MMMFELGRGSFGRRGRKVSRFVSGGSEEKKVESSLSGTSSREDEVIIGRGNDYLSQIEIRVPFGRSFFTDLGMEKSFLLACQERR
jgi:hypothetical protein